MLRYRCPNDPQHQLEKYATRDDILWCEACRVTYSIEDLVMLHNTPGKKTLSTHEPPPVRSLTQPAVWDLVVHDISERDKGGEKKYGTRLQPHNGRDALIDAYQEALDLVVYLRQFIYERDGK